MCNKNTCYLPKLIIMYSCRFNKQVVIISFSQNLIWTHKVMHILTCIYSYSLSRLILALGPHPITGNFPVRLQWNTHTLKLLTMMATNLTYTYVNLLASIKVGKAQVLCMLTNPGFISLTSYCFKQQKGGKYYNSKQKTSHNI